MATLVVDIEGQTAELTGSAEEQFIKWRELLREIYSTETGLPIPEIHSDGESAPEKQIPIPAAEDEQNPSGKGGDAAIGAGLI